MSIALKIGQGLLGRGGRVPLPLDNIAAVVAYSARKLRTAHAGPAIRVRRSSDNVEADIGFGADGWLDQTALLLHSGENLFLQSSNMAVTSAWVPSGFTVTASGTSPSGQPAFFYNETATTSVHNVQQGMTWVAGAVHVVSYDIKDAGRGIAQVLFNSGVTNFSANVNLTTGATQIVSAGGTITVTSLGNGWWRVVLGITVGAGGPQSAFVGGASSLAMGRNGSYLGEVGKGILVSRPQVVNGSTEKGYAATTTLAFSGQNGFVATWYDQSVTEQHATQATAANQPRIVNAGVVQALNGRSIVDQVTINGRLNIPAFSGITSALVNAVYAQAAANNGFAPWQLNQVDHLPWTNALAYAGPFSATRPLFTSWSAGANELIVASAVQSGTTLAVYRNGTQNGTTQASAFALPVSQGNRTIFGGLSGSGFVSELIVLASAPTTIERQALERNQGTAYGITVA